MTNAHPTRNLGIVLLAASLLCLTGIATAERPLESGAAAPWLDNADRQVRIDAAAALARTGDLAHEPAQLRTAIGAMDDPVEDVRLYAVSAVAAAAYGADAGAIESLRPASDALVARLQDPSGQVQGAAARALALIGTPPRAMNDLLTLVRQSEDTAVRRSAVEALARLPHTAPVVTDLLQRTLREDAAAPVRGTAAVALAELGPSSREVIAALTAALADTDEFVQQQAIRALTKLGPDAAVAVPELEQLAASTDDRAVERQARYAVRSLRGESTETEQRETVVDQPRAPAGSPPGALH